jgi:hypothetical protein
MNEHRIHTLALGLYAEWQRETRVNRRHMVRQAYWMPPGPERLAAIKFLRMVEEAERSGQDARIEVAGRMDASVVAV